MNKQVVAGIDIGGTKIAVALETVDGERVASRRLPTETALRPEKIIENISSVIEEMLGESKTKLAAIGIGCPGPIDVERGLALSPTNLPNWIDFPLVEKFKNRFDVPVAFDNDANAAALGEYFYGAGKDFNEIFYVTISTGIGGALVCGGQIRHGVSGNAGEVGHTIVNPDGRRCLCGANGCLETIASGLSIARRMKEKLAENNGGKIENYSHITAQTVVEAVEKTDEIALEIWRETIKFLAIGIGNAITLTAPEAVIIGGGVSSAGELLLEPLRRELAKNVMMLPVEKVKILRASLGGESGLCGALFLARRSLRQIQKNV